MEPLPPKLLSDKNREALRKIVGEKGVVDPADAPAYQSASRGRWTGDAAMILAPNCVADIAAVIKFCASEKIAVTPQGGNTGQVGGQIPIGGEVLLSTKRLRAVRDVSPLNNTLTLEAGITLLEAQNIAIDNDRLFPLSIGAEGTCQIGGVISTNAGGVNVLRYGNMRDLVLGLEVVLPNGDIWNGLKRLRKDNTGYHLKHLFIGAEGTLGIVTAAVLKLFPRPAEKKTVLAATKGPEAAVELLSLADARSGGAVTSFEFIGGPCIDLVLKNIPDTKRAFASDHDFYVLMEFSAGVSGVLDEPIEVLLNDAMEKTLIDDAVIAASSAQSEALWKLRHSISPAIDHEGLGIRHDISVATSDIPAFLEKADRAVHSIAPDARIIAFGHMGDGNIHYDIVGAPGAAADVLEPIRLEIETAVYAIIAEYEGSVSAEHGVGRARIDAMAAQKSSAELAMMNAIKYTFDPGGIMNPGKILKNRTE